MLLLDSPGLGGVFAHVLYIVDKRVKTVAADILGVGDIIPALFQIGAVIKMGVVPPAFFDGFF